jgi:hypothetical protein
MEVFVLIRRAHASQQHGAVMVMPEAKNPQRRRKSKTLGVSCQQARRQEKQHQRRWH